jgi:hypothetical protein
LRYLTSRENQEKDRNLAWRVTYCREAAHLKRLLRELSSEKTPGPSPSFSPVHVVKALEVISEGPIGRNRLSDELLLGEGATRTLIERLKTRDLITVDRAGCKLSRKGKEVWKALHAVFPRKIALEGSGLTLARFNVAVLVRGRSDRVKMGIEQRDASLLSGAKGATTLLLKDGELTVPPSQWKIAEDFPEIHRELVDMLKPSENDVIVIGSADSLKKAEYGAWGAALTLIDQDVTA